MNRFTARDMLRSDEDINIYTYAAHKDEAVHTHEFLEIVYVVSGAGSHCIGGTWFPVERGNVLFINLGQTHAFSTQGQMELTNLLLLPRFIDRDLVNADNALELLALSAFSELYFDSSAFLPAIALSGKELLGMERLLRDMQEEFSGKSPNYRTALKGYVYILFTKLFRAMQQEQDEVVRQMGRITPEILSYIEQNYAKKLTLQELAGRCFYSASYFSRVFKEAFGITFTDYIGERRLQRAAELLLSTALSVTEICERVGFHDRKQFYKRFREYAGSSPTEYRRSREGSAPAIAGDGPRGGR